LSQILGFRTGLSAWAAKARRRDRPLAAATREIMAVTGHSTLQ
jgi:hypothetical protein